MFSSIWNGITNAASSIGNTISSWFGGGGNQSANALQGTYIPGSYNPNSGSPQATSYSPGGTTYYGGYTPPGGSSMAGQMDSGNNMSATTISAGGGNLLSQALGSINAGQQNYGSSGGGGSYAQNAQNLYQTYYRPQPTTVNAKNLNMPSPTYGGAGAMTNTGSPLVLPNSSSAQSTNPRMDTTGMAGNMAGFYTRNADGSFTQVKDTTDNSNDKIIKDVRGLYDELGVKPTTAEDPDVMQARQQRQRIQQSLLAPTAELNAIIAKQNTDLLSHRKMVSEGGGTETGFGGIESAINYNAAIRALPLQAQISSLQGDLKLAQDYLSELTQVKQEQIDNQYNFKASVLKSIEDKVDKRDQRVYEEMKTANERSYQMNRDNIKFQDDWQMLAAKNGDGSMVKQIAMLNPSAPNFRQKLGEITGGASTMSGTGMAGGADNLLLNAVYNVNAGSAEGQQKRDIAQVQQLVSSGQTEKAKALLMSRVISKMSAGERQSELDRRNTIDALETMQTALGEYVSSTGDTNILRGGVENIANKIGTTSNPALASIKARIIQATQKYRNAITGAAWGEQEDAEYRSIFPSISNTKKLNDTIITTMLDALKSNERNAVGMFLGGTDIYDGIWGGSSASNSNNMQEVTITPDDNALFNSIVIPRSGTTVRSDIPANNPLSGGNLSNSSPFFRLFR